MDVNITTASVPEDFCFQNWPQGWAFLVSLLSAEVAGTASFFNYGPNTPAPDERDRPWIRLDASGNIDKMYSYSNGAWVAKHPAAPGDVIMYEGTEASIDTHDGGEAGAITATTGPMWQKVSTINGRFPLGPGTLASGATVNVGDTGGAEEHILTRAELPNVSVDTLSQRRINVQDGGSAVVTTPDTASTGAAFQATALPTEPLGDGDGHNNMPPYLGIWFIRRTSRTHYRI